MLCSEDRLAMIEEYRVPFASVLEGERATWLVNSPRARALQVGVSYTRKRRLEIVRLKEPYV